MRMHAIVTKIFLVTAACGPDHPSTSPDGGADADVSDGNEDEGNQPLLNPVLGTWTGTATVTGGRFLSGGDFAAKVVLAQSGDHVRGFIDVRQNAQTLAEAFGYFVDGTISAAGQLDLTATDRVCGAGDPVGLCYPNSTVEPVFHIRGAVSGQAMTLDQVTIMSVTYPSDVPVEPPFVVLRATHEGPTYAPDPHPLASRWSGRLVMPESLAVLAPLPMHGDNTVAISNAYVVAGWDNEIAGNIVPRFDDIILPTSLATTPATGRTWWKQTATLDYAWLYAARRSGNTLSGVVGFDAYANPLHNSGAPKDLADIPLIDTVAVFTFQIDP